MTTRNPDWDLIEAARHGDRAAFGELWTRCYPSIHRFALRRTGSRRLAEDFTSETFVRAWRAIDMLAYESWGDWARR